MIQSMTGHGRSESSHKDLAIVAELRSTNHKYCDVVIRLPKFLLSLESPLKKQIQQHFTRGRFDLAVTVNGAAAQRKRLDLDLDLAEQYFKILKQLKSKLELSGQTDLALLAGFRDIITLSEPAEAGDDLTRKVQSLVKEAMTRLEAMRRQEGKALAKDLLQRLKLIEKKMRLIELRIPGIVADYHTRLQARIEQLTRGIKLEPARLAQEVALFAERSDITEEVTRLKSHMGQFRTMLRGKESVGRSLDFLIQELNREVNTIGSKSGDAAVALEVVGIKSEIEKLREQVQNIE
ncbi:MAG TPA: YicC/YloC family endoribonuclease [Nitrospiria bacterium]